MMPGENQAVKVRVRQRLERTLSDQLEQRRAVHPVEHLPWHLTVADAEEVWQILAPPSVRECPGIDRQMALLGDGGHFRRDASAPVDHGAENVEGEHLEIRFGYHADLLTLFQLEVGAVDRVFGMPQDVQQPRVHGNEDAADLGSSLF